MQPSRRSLDPFELLDDEAWDVPDHLDAHDLYSHGLTSRSARDEREDFQ